MEKDKYLGPFKVVGVTELDIKTPLGSDVVSVMYENRPAEIMPKKNFDLLVSSEPTDLNEMQKTRFNVMIPKVIEALAEYDVKMFEMSSLLTQVHETVEQHLERVSSFLWTKNDGNWVPGMNFTNNRTVVEIHKMLVENKIGKEGIKEYVKPDSQNSGGGA